MYVNQAINQSFIIYFLLIQQSNYRYNKEALRKFTEMTIKS